MHEECFTPSVKEKNALNSPQVHEMLSRTPEEIIPSAETFPPPKEVSMVQEMSEITHRKPTIVHEVSTTPPVIEKCALISPQVLKIPSKTKKNTPGAVTACRALIENLENLENLNLHLQKEKKRLSPLKIDLRENKLSKENIENLKRTGEKRKRQGSPEEIYGKFDNMKKLVGKKLENLLLNNYDRAEAATKFEFLDKMTGRKRDTISCTGNQVPPPAPPKKIQSESPVIEEKSVEKIVKEKERQMSGKIQKFVQKFQNNLPTPRKKTYPTGNLATPPTRKLPGKPLPGNKKKEEIVEGKGKVRKKITSGKTLEKIRKENLKKLSLGGKTATPKKGKERNASLSGNSQGHPQNPPDTAKTPTKN